MRTFDQRARKLLNEVGLFNMFALPSAAPGLTNNNCDHQLLPCLNNRATPHLLATFSCLLNVMGLVNTWKIFHPAAVKIFQIQSSKNCPRE